MYIYKSIRICIIFSNEKVVECIMVTHTLLVLGGYSYKC